MDMHDFVLSPEMLIAGNAGPYVPAPSYNANPPPVGDRRRTNGSVTKSLQAASL